MAINYRGEGVARDFPYIIQSGITITAGSLIWADVSGTNVVHPVQSYSGVTVESAAPATGVGFVSLDAGSSGVFGTAGGIFLGVLARTQTGISQNSGGSQTGVTVFRNGIFEFAWTPTASSQLQIGYNAYAVSNDTVRGLREVDTTNTNATATPVAVGRIVGYPDNPARTSTGVTVATRVYVAIETFKTLDGIL